MTHRWLVGIGVVLALAAALALIAGGAPASLADNNIIYVDADAPGPTHDGSSWENAYIDLQLALADADPGQQIWVAEGTYKPTDTTDRTISFQMKNGVAIYGGFAGTETELGPRDWVANPTILSGDLSGNDLPGFINNGENSYHVFYHPDGTALDSTAVLDGFTITGGNANGATSPDWDGGGMYNNNSSPALTNCTFAGNSATTVGGGMYNKDGSSPTLTSCTFEGNDASGDGGGMYNSSSSPTLTDCTFEGNEAGSYGSGMYNDSSSPTLTNCTFTDNSANYGGGMFNDSSSPTLTNCTFTGNSATYYGGGMDNYYSSSPTLTNCTFSGNSANYGGGMDNYDSSSPTLTNCTFAGNSAYYGGGGMYNDYYSSPTLTNCTFAGNEAGDSGGGMFNNDSAPTLTNCILWGDTAGGLPNEISNDESSTPLVTFSDIQGGYPDPGTTNIDEDPLFVNAESGDLHLGPGSPCIDAGTDNVPDPPGLPDTDFEGDPRIIDGDSDGDPVVDMGADEARVRVYLPLVLKNY